MIEAWGQGIERTFASCYENNVALPEIRYESDGLWAEFSIWVGDDLSANQSRILELLAENPKMSASELAKSIGVSKRKIEANMSKLKKANRLKQVGTAKGGHWVVL